jgi:MFS family permease
LQPLPAKSPALSNPEKISVLVGVGLGLFMSTLDAGIINVAVPSLLQAFHTNFPTAQWTVLSYLLVSSGLVLGATGLGNMWRKKYLYLAGLMVFTFSSLLCGLAPSIDLLIGFRALQGLGAVFISGLDLSIITEVSLSSETGRAVDIIASVVSLGIAFGPSVAGMLLDWLGWRSLLLINLPIGVVASFLLLGRYHLLSLVKKNSDLIF